MQQANEARGLVSVVVTNHNYERYLPSAVESALAQSYDPVEVILVDDGSTDGSREIVSGIGERVRAVLKENGGQASAFNAGFAASEGEVVCFLDSDDLFHADKVARVMDVFSSRPDAGWVFHALEMRTDDDTRVGRTPEHGSRECDYRRAIRRGRLRLRTPATSGVCIRRGLLSEILPMPEEEGVALSDSYIKHLAIAKAAGYYLDEELGVQRLHDSNLFTGRSGEAINGTIPVVTAYWIRRAMPELARFANLLMARGLAGRPGERGTALARAYLADCSTWERALIFGRMWRKRALAVLRS